MMITDLDHVQIAMPAGAEDDMRAFYCNRLEMTEVTKPPQLQGRGGFWVEAGRISLHFGIDPSFTPAKKAHPAFRVTDIAALAQELGTAGHPVRWDDTLPGVHRFFTDDPAGNRVEIIADV